MGGNTFGYRQAESAGTYWRRRFVMLVLGFAAFGLAAWGLSAVLAVSTGSGGSPATGHRTDSVRQGGHHKAHPAKSASPSRQRGRSGKDAGTDTGKHASGSDRSAVKPATRQGAGQATGHGQILPAFCARRNIVLSIFTGQTQFGPGQTPAFDVNVVSTQIPECTFNIGSQHLALVIREGPALIWNSADCAAGAGELDAALKRGVPTVLAISWNRQTSAPGCSVRTTRVPPGVYTAYATEGDITSQPVTFRLS
ncbi:MAG TPA: hypothetical protein VMA95_04045 [Streptosporangiaceae bacterium]|nr:hypothetical protein [Streptosporangiaceae bacterium]